MAKSIGKRILNLAMENDISQRELAFLINVNEATISRIINQDRTPSLETCIDIAKVFNVTLDELVGNATKKEKKGVTPDYASIKLALSQSVSKFTIEQKAELLTMLSNSLLKKNKSK